MSEVKYRSAVAASFAAVLLSSCAVGPDFVQASAPDVDRYTKEPLAPHTSSADVRLGQSQHFVSGQNIPAEWWLIFRSPQLNSLVRKALDANPNLQSTLAALRLAKENVYAQQAKYFPLVQANFNPSRGLTPASLSSPLATAPVDNLFNLFTAQVLVSYTFDTWGGNRRAVESLQAVADAQRFQVEAAYLTLVANVVVAAVQEASLRAQIDATNRLIEINTKALAILHRQLQDGYASRIDVAVQEAQLAQFRATLPPLRKALAQQRDLISALTGRLPSQEPYETFRLRDLHLPTDLPVSLPAQLVDQRPDVRAAEEQLHSASALVGVAVANMLPNLTIGANSGYTATSVASLFTGPAVFWTVAGNATQPIFDGFNLLHLERASQAAYEQSAWSYRTTVVAAFQNVADSLRAIQNDADTLKAAREFEKASKISLDLTRQQLENGQANILLLLTTQQTYEQALLQVVQAEAARISDTAALFQALGGGWWNRVGPPAPEQKFEVATGRYIPVAEYPDWLTVVTEKALSSRADASAPGQKSTVANEPSSPPKESGTPDAASLSQPVSLTADNQSQVTTANLAGEGGKP
jgi:NodT family efflux transporter outer membrane factor (OMF) lipoprotein